MKKHISFVLAMLVLAACFAAAQTQPSIKVDIPFSFAIEGKTLPAGMYEFKERPEPSRVAAIRITNTKSKDAVFANIISRLDSRGPAETEIVFDVVGNDHFLSEVYIPGADGYLIKATPGQHTHVRLLAQK